MTVPFQIWTLIRTDSQDFQGKLKNIYYTQQKILFNHKMKIGDLMHFSLLSTSLD